MKRFSKKWFAQIMINKLVKQELNQLKNIIRIDTHAEGPISYNDEIKYLIKKFKESKRIEVPLEPKLFLGSSFKDPGLKIAYSLES